jgi:tetratricopeptide (TPR) repeat protein
MQDVIDTLRAAIAHHQAARHAEAEALYRTVLGEEPGHPRALYLYGLLLLDIGRAHEAVAMLEKATVSQPGHAATLTNLMRALLADGRPAEALAMASSCALQGAEIAFLRGTALNALGRPPPQVCWSRRLHAIPPMPPRSSTWAMPVPISIAWKRRRRIAVARSGWRRIWRKPMPVWASY